MKKVLALLSIVALTSCGNGTSTEVTTDSVSVIVDSTKVGVADSSTAKIAVDSVKEVK